MLDLYRVIDLSDERGLLCGAILADLGAEVIHIEPSGGSRARQATPQDSLWEAWARNSKSVTLDIDLPSDRDRLRRLISTADFFIESEPPGALEALGLGYTSLAEDNPALVYVSISPFGQTGPRAQDPATDLIVEAGAGVTIAVGDADRPPLHIGGNHAWAHAGAEAAGAALIAHHERRRTGLGQHVDVSAQEATALAAGFQTLAGLLGASPTRRSGGGIVVGPIEIPTIFQAADGFVSLTFFFGQSQGPYTRRTMEWIHESGECDELTRDKDWVEYLNLLLSGDEPIEELHRVLGIVERFIGERQVASLYAEAQRRRIMLVPAWSLEQVLDDPQLEERGYWWRADDLPGQPKVGGAFARFSATPLTYRHRAPSPGEHTAAITAEHRERIRWGSDAPSGQALDDVKVLDFTWIMAGPWATRVLRDYGATVVKVESDRRLDGIRLLPPFINGHSSPEHSGGFQSTNAGKLSLALDPNTDVGREVVLDLVRWADVVTESFSPKAMRAWRLDYDTLRQEKPDLIMLSSSLFGQTGPYALLPGVGTMGAATSGFIAMTGWPDRRPSGPWGPYTDFCSPRLSVAAVLAALDHRARTGEGQHIDVAQTESSMPFIAPELVDLSVHGRRFEGNGNGDRVMAPHGVYPTSGLEEWVAIVVRDDDDWPRLCAAMHDEELADNPELATAESRRTQTQHLDEAISKWTVTQSSLDVERQLRNHGVPVAALADHRTLDRDPQLRHRGHVLEVPHSLHGTTYVESSHVLFSRTPARVTRAGPTIGEHTDFVLRDILGYGDAKIRDLRRAGAIPQRPEGEP